MAHWRSGFRVSCSLRRSLCLRATNGTCVCARRATAFQPSASSAYWLIAYLPLACLQLAPALASSKTRTASAASGPKGVSQGHGAHKVAKLLVREPAARCGRASTAYAQCGTAEPAGQRMPPLSEVHFQNFTPNAQERAGRRQRTSQPSRSGTTNSSSLCGCTTKIPACRAATVSCSKR